MYLITSDSRTQQIRVFTKLIDAEEWCAELNNRHNIKQIDSEWIDLNSDRPTIETGAYILDADEVENFLETLSN